LDHFKKINDSCGHEAGDPGLKRFAGILKGNTRSSNMCGRIGGEEFVIALSHGDRIGVETAVDRIRRQFEAEEFLFDRIVVKATASFGIAGFRGSNAPVLDELLRKADEALYIGHTLVVRWLRREILLKVILCPLIERSPAAPNRHRK
jgi:diguanylate cyclase (GGDEF)-like protein